jgi:hypothetical protein
MKTCWRNVPFTELGTQLLAEAVRKRAIFSGRKFGLLSSILSVTLCQIGQHIDHKPNDRSDEEERIDRVH